MTLSDPEYAIVGGGVVGLSVAYGLLVAGRSVCVIDEGDVALRASRGNFGLVWVQGKGVNAPPYARWTQTSARLWPAYAKELARQTGLDVALRQGGGLDHHLSEESLENKARAYQALRDQLDGDYPFEVLDRRQLESAEPAIGPDVAGAILHHEDGHVNPLRLLRALATAVRSLGGQVDVGAVVDSVAPGASGFLIKRKDGSAISAQRLVLCAGLGAARLGPMVGLKAPVSPQRGQILVTEKLPPFLNRPSSLIRQVDEGGVQIGNSKEAVGFDDRDTIDTAAAMANQAVRIYPALRSARLVRHWAALRVMSPDGLPIYQHSVQCPGASLITCHSGITLSAVHARLMPQWLERRADAPDLEFFGEQRFGLSQA